MDLVVVGKDYLALQATDMKEVAEIIGAENITPFDLPKVNVPSGGALSWEVVTLEGGVESVKEIKGILVHFLDQRAMWLSKYEGGSSPPDCVSLDCMIGQGQPGGVCAECPYSKFGSAIDGGPSKACKEIRFLFVLEPGNFLPTLISLPPTSVKPNRKFNLALASKGIPFYRAEISIVLEKDKSQGGIQYSKALPKLVRKIEDEETIAKVDAYRATIKKAIAIQTVGDAKKAMEDQQDSV